jgi:hypothetical protein
MRLTNIRYTNICRKITVIASTNTNNMVPFGTFFYDRKFIIYTDNIILRQVNKTTINRSKIKLI